jgi:hypothetical protein
VHFAELGRTQHWRGSGTILFKSADIGMLLLQKTFKNSVALNDSALSFGHAICE